MHHQQIPHHHLLLPLADKLDPAVLPKTSFATSIRSVEEEEEQADSLGDAEACAASGILLVAVFHDRGPPQIFFSRACHLGVTCFTATCFSTAPYFIGTALFAGTRLDAVPLLAACVAARQLNFHHTRTVVESMFWVLWP
jgi:hypothetical protein